MELPPPPPLRRSSAVLLLYPRPNVLRRRSSSYSCSSCEYDYGFVDNMTPAPGHCPICEREGTAVRTVGGVTMDPETPCPGCESGIDADGPHRGPDGVYYPTCCTRAAEASRA